MAKIIVIATIQIAGTHQWSECPLDDVDFLKHPHRHLFKITVKKEVSHTERDTEIIMLGQQVTNLLKTHFGRINWTDMLDFGNSSCETIAEFIGKWLPDLSSCEVLEDGENGAEIIWK